MLFNARGLPIPVTDPSKDLRTPAMKEWDRRFRAQMGDNGGQTFPREWVDKVKRMMFRRDIENAVEKDMEARDSRSSLDEYGDRALSDARSRSKRQVITG